VTLPDGPGAPPVPRVCLVVLDGWGLAEPGEGNAVDAADTPVFDELWETCRHTRLTAWGEAVGLPEGQMGNSEVGHLNLGAGAIVKQDLTRIGETIEDGSFFDNEVLKAACEAAKKSGRLHLLGLVSKGGVHASMDHLRACVELAKREGVEDVVLHAFTDGRDTGPHSGEEYIAEAEGWDLRIATVTGRYWAMDRDKRWERIEKALNAIVKGESEVPEAESGEAAVKAAYERDETDEFIEPTLVGEEGRVRDGDSLLFLNFRSDRARQLTEKLGALDVTLTTLTEYNEDWDYPVAFPPARPETTLAKTLADAGVEQLHVAETEKYAHVTYFFNGGEEHPYGGEKRELVDSPRDVKTYDEKPEMSAAEAADAFVEHWSDGDFGFGIINFANPDMVGHTGDIPAAVKAVEAADEGLGKVVAAVHESGGALIVTADHGNADDMLEDDGGPQTAHSMNPVPLIVTAEVGELREGGILADVAPTVLALLGRDQPEAMTGRSLIEPDE
jgi:2,3-bisphosphoglycerate-independent phosphoglycerate mutase